jgi:hypothetical protein
MGFPYLLYNNMVINVDIDNKTGNWSEASDMKLLRQLSGYTLAI